MGSKLRGRAVIDSSIAVYIVSKNNNSQSRRNIFPMYVFKDLHNLPSLQNSREGKMEQHFKSLSSVGVDLFVARSIFPSHRLRISSS